jgi:hypothetical protein
VSEVIKSTGAPTPNGFNSPNLQGRDAGYRYSDPRIDDETALAAAKKLNPSQAVLRDAAALEIQFDRFANGQLGNDYMVPGWVAQNGLDENHRRGVEEMVNEMGRIARIDPAVMQELRSMYADGIDTQSVARAGGLKPYGQRPGEYGEWNR